MKAVLLWVIVVGFGCLGAVVMAELPVLGEDEGKRAFDDLGALYREKGNTPAYTEAIVALTSEDKAARASAGRYLHALFAQSFADEANGRAEWRKTPFWGGGSESDAREFRERLTRDFGEKAGGVDALPAVEWLLKEEKLAAGPRAAVDVLLRVEGAEADEMIRAHVRDLHPNGEVAERLIEQANARGLKDLGETVVAFQHHHRTAVRNAARRAATRFGRASEIAVFAAEKAVASETVKSFFAEIEKMQLVAVAESTKWCSFEHTDPEHTRDGKPYVQSYAGWLLAEEDDAYRILDRNAREMELEKEHTKMEESSLADFAKSLLEIREGEEPESKLSRRGGLTGQFQPRFISVPEILVGLWSYQRGDLKTAAAVLLPRYDDAADDRYLVWAARDLFGNPYHQEMLRQFSHSRDYPRAIALAEHLSKPVFDGYRYQNRAEELAEQLRERGDDFGAFALPTAEAWNAQKAKMPRREQIDFLVSRLRLLNCFQWGQPGGVSYTDDQYAKAGWEEKAPVINPFTELREMELAVADLDALIPFVADDNFMPTFSYWRDFHPSRTLHRVNWVVAELVNAAARKELVDLRRFNGLDETDRAEYLAEIVAWCEARAGRSVESLIVETLESSEDRREFASAVEEAIEEGYESALAPVLKRFSDAEIGSRQRDSLAGWAFALPGPGALEAAGKWLKDDSGEVRFYGALIVARDGGKEALGRALDVLQAYFVKHPSYESYLPAVDVLLGSGDERAMKMACGGLEDAGLEISWGGSGEMVRRLLVAGRKEAHDYLLAGFGDPKRRGEIAAVVAGWRLDKFEYHPYGTDEEYPDNPGKRAELKEWLNTQFEKIRAGEKPEMKLEESEMRAAEWQVDAP